MRTIDDVLRGLHPIVRGVGADPLPTPPYCPPAHDVLDRLPRVGLAVESMKRHTTDEGWQLFAGLEAAGYLLFGQGLSTRFTVPATGEVRRGVDWVDVGNIVKYAQPSTVVLQDHREWDVKPGDFRDAEARFLRAETLAWDPSVFKVTILKDAHQRPEYHRKAAHDIGCHAWIIYYHPSIVCHLAPYVRPEHLIRTYHTVDPDAVPYYRVEAAESRVGCLLSGALSGAYPLRVRLVQERDRLPETTYLAHPGYHRRGSHTPGFLQELTKYRSALCTSSIYGYALRKIIEATACGCRVVTDLPQDEVLPDIDDNLVRIPPTATAEQVAAVLEQIHREYDPAFQARMADAAVNTYNYHSQGRRLADQIERLRRHYPCST